MKILHTSDWHLGHILYQNDRTEEQQSMLDQMAKIVKDEQPDLFLLCGDIYHTSQPSNAVVSMFNTAIAKLCHQCPSMTMVIIAGNHDSASKHEVFRTPWEMFNVHTIGYFDKDNLTNHIIEIEDKGIVVALPFTHERNLRNGEINQLLELANECNINNLPIVLTGHTAVSGADFTGHEQSTETNIGGIDTIKITDIASEYDYLALGHIHKPQFIHTGKHNVRYSGSPIAVSFDEQYEHSVTILEINKHGEALTNSSFRTIAIKNPLPLVNIPKDGFGKWEDVRKELEAFPTQERSYIRLNVELGDDDLPSLLDNEAKVITQEKQCRYCYLNAFRSTQNTQQQFSELTISEFQQTEPIDIAKRYAQDKSEDFGDDMTDMFNEVIAAIKEEDNQ